jgi:hypothetical protein
MPAKVNSVVLKDTAFPQKKQDLKFARGLPTLRDKKAVTVHISSGEA